MSKGNRERGKKFKTQEQLTDLAKKMRITMGLEDLAKIIDYVAEESDAPLEVRLFGLAILMEVTRQFELSEREKNQ